MKGSGWDPVLVRLTRTVRWALALAVGAVGGVAFHRGFASPVEAEHDIWPNLYVRSMVQGGGPETTCVWSSWNSSVSQPVARQRVDGTLTSASHWEEDWNGTGPYVGFAGQVMWNPCPGLYNPGAAVIAIYVMRQADVDWFCGGFFVAGCAWHEDEVGHPVTQGPSHHVSIYIHDGSLTTHTINHEVGHALGLCDGGRDVYPDPNCEPSGIHYDCTGSVMHSYGCGNSSDWPTAEDRRTVQRISGSNIDDSDTLTFGGNPCHRGMCFV